MGITRIGAEKLMPTSLELGGKSPTIVCADADLDHAVAGVLYCIFSSSGEFCIASSRAFLYANRYAEFKSRLQAGVKALRVGDPSSEATQMRPLVSQSYCESVERYVQLGMDEGATLLAGCVRPRGVYDKGRYYTPTVMGGLPNIARMMQEEILAWRRPCCPGVMKPT